MAARLGKYSAGVIVRLVTVAQAAAVVASILAPGMEHKITTTGSPLAPALSMAHMEDAR